MIRMLYVSAVSACFERVNDSPYYAPAPFAVYLDGAEHCTAKTNVFSLFDLTPDTAYTLTLSDEGSPFCFRTRGETFAVSVKDFGAVGDGVHEDTSAIQSALDFLPPGGRLILPAGTYLTLPLRLKSHTTLELKKGATLLGSPDREKYPILPGEVTDPVTGESRIFGTFEGLIQPMYQALLSAQNAEGIQVVGEGTIDGNAQNSDFWTDFRSFPAARPRLVSLLHCKKVVFHGVTAQNAPSWNFHPFHSERLGFYDISVFAPKDSPNTDAMDPEACDGVEIFGCRFSVGDDCIAIKSGKIELARRFDWPALHHTVRNCLMEYGHGAVTLGSETAMGVRELTVSQCFFRQTDRGLRIKTRRGRGEKCDITDIAFENIRMDGVLTPVVVNMWYNCCDPDRFSEYVWSRQQLPVDQRTPHLGSFRFSNMVCTGAQAAACYIDGLPERPIDAVTLENVSVSFDPNAKPSVPAMQNFARERCKLGLYFENVGEVKLHNVRVTGADGDEVVAPGCGHVERR